MSPGCEKWKPQNFWTFQRKWVPKKIGAFGAGRSCQGYKIYQLILTEIAFTITLVINHVVHDNNYVILVLLLCRLSMVRINKHCVRYNISDDKFVRTVQTCTRTVLTTCSNIIKWFSNLGSLTVYEKYWEIWEDRRYYSISGIASQFDWGRYM